MRRPFSMVRRRTHKLVVERAKRREKLFDLATDPDERRDVTADHSDIVASMVRALETRRTRAPRAVPTPLSNERREQLEALGYVE